MRTPLLIIHGRIFPYEFIGPSKLTVKLRIRTYILPTPIYWRARDAILLLIRIEKGDPSVAFSPKPV